MIDVLVPWQYESDANASDPFRRKHNREQLVLMVVKTVAIVVADYPVAILVLFCCLLASHVLTMVGEEIIILLSL
jgi:hypothetical protein